MWKGEIDPSIVLWAQPHLAPTFSASIAGVTMLRTRCLKYLKPTCQMSFPHFQPLF